ncbi:succinylglutamate desuccinylase/aspartoacylase family protein [Neptunicella marina]|uniref:Succinylglutamate desuccinylase/aspartoacylase family protein n=1 Tax=Neptunicella marina TaxID=2125989 RepID=A0A8J6IUY1_9ALTE|nr:succinylglutamate desuccinylase/aspartoacylase family protein [Neptunicella marina]MBC3765958.1 succinylglutamate desuccinylase/aspartoacylase family protein [Neptunicella marina]
MARKRAPFELAETVIPAGRQVSVKIPAVRLYTDTPMDLHVEVFHGVKDGPTLLVCAAVHGDELNGIDICRRLIKKLNPKRLHGTVMIVPIVNVFGFIQQTRYLPDRRDLNRCFPGSDQGTVGSRLAYLFSSMLMCRASHIIDLHTGAIHRSNMPQIRANIKDPAALAMAEAFHVPIILHAKELDGSVRATASKLGASAIIYEAGEALRFDQAAIKAGLNGVLNVMKELGMVQRRGSRVKFEPLIANHSQWVRNEYDGVIINRIQLGSRVNKGQIIGYSASPHGDTEHPIRSPIDGVVIGISNIPVANEGEALFHIAKISTEQITEAGEIVDSFIEDFDTRVL